MVIGSRTCTLYMVIGGFDLIIYI